MDIMIDSNVIISAAIFPNARMDSFLECVSEEHQLFVCSYSLEEVIDVVKRKWPNRLHSMELFLRSLSYSYVRTPSLDILDPDVVIRDDDDYPVLASAILADVDILITGDHDFDDLSLDRPEIMTIRDFITVYM